MLRAFWHHAQSWADRPEVRSDVPWAALADSEDQESPDVQVVAMSDSLLLSTVREYTLESFFALAASLQRYIERHAALHSYCIVSRGNEVERPNVGFTTNISGSEYPAYRHLVGTGTAWADMMDADHEIRQKNKREWHGKYRLYTVGINEGDVPQTFRKTDETTFSSKWGGANVHVLALLPVMP